MTAAELLLEVCRRTIDSRATVVRCHGNRVLRAATRLGGVIVKLHHRPERHQQEPTPTNTGYRLSVAGLLASWLPPTTRPRS